MEKVNEIPMVNSCIFINFSPIATNLKQDFPTPVVPNNLTRTEVDVKVLILLVLK